ncbi:RDD family protein [Alteribacillus sp. HJP-4]|uniref:RDD family protein n=1 Tax=Alteribacillus sp. HJP-4 TaxID=2775394 RepID=UPI0035CCF360
MEYKAGSFWRRLAAVLLDGIVVAALSFIIFYLMGGNLTSSPTENWVQNLISLLYGMVLPAVWSGYTLGKKALGVRIIKMDGSNVSLWTMFLRYFVGGLVMVVTLGTALIASIIMIIVREDKRVVHDFIAGTRVIKA